MQRNYIADSERVDVILATMRNVAEKHKNDDVGRLTSKMLASIEPSLGRLGLFERNTFEAALLSIVSSILMAVAAASRRESIIDHQTHVLLKAAAADAVALLKPKTVVMRWSMPHDESPPPSWERSISRVGGFERVCQDGKRMHIIKDIHVSGVQWVLYYSGLAIETSETLIEAAEAAAAFERFMAIAA